MANAPDDEWVDQVFEPTPSAKRATPESDAPAIEFRRVNPYGSEGAEARARREEALARSTRRAKQSRRGNPILLVAGALAAAGMLWAQFPVPPVREATPSALIGSWETRHASYANARLAISEEHVTIAPPGGAAVSHRIVALRTTTSADGTDVRLSYESPTGIAEMNVRLVPTGARWQLAFARPQGLIWERAADVSATRAAPTRAAPTRAAPTR